MENQLSDIDKIKRILNESGLNNTQFSSKISISPGALSSVLSGRTNPTLTILRNIVTAFPRINPGWLFEGNGPMYRDAVSSSSQTDHPSPSSAGGELPFLPIDLDSVNEPEVTPVSSPGSEQVPSPARVAPETSNTLAAITPGMIESMATSVASKLQSKPRQISEIRIFYDDGTYEKFTPSH